MKTIYVDCPFCNGMMEVNPSTGKIVQKWEPGGKSAEGTDKMSAALKKLTDEKKRRNNLFSEKKEELEGKKKELLNSFQKEVDEIKKKGLGEKPMSPFDLD